MRIIEIKAPITFIILGVVGDSNTKCHAVNNTSPGLTVGGTDGTYCTSGGTCLYGLCLGNVCSAPRLTCPTIALGKKVRYQIMMPITTKFLYAVSLHPCIYLRYCVFRKWCLQVFRSIEERSSQLYHFRCHMHCFMLLLRWLRWK